MQDVDIVYIATPHTKHFSAGKLALEAGKNVLIEKVSLSAMAGSAPSSLARLTALHSQRGRVQVPH